MTLCNAYDLKFTKIFNNYLIILLCVQIIRYFRNFFPFETVTIIAKDHIECNSFKITIKVRIFRKISLHLKLTMLYYK